MKPFLSLLTLAVLVCFAPQARTEAPLVTSKEAKPAENSGALSHAGKEESTGTCPEGGPSQAEVKKAAEEAGSELATGPILPRELLKKLPKGTFSEFRSMPKAEYGAYLREYSGEMILDPYHGIRNPKGLIDLLLREPYWSKKLRPDQIKRLTKRSGDTISETSKESFDELTDGLTDREKLNLALELDTLHFTEGYSNHVLSQISPTTHALRQVLGNQIMDAAMVKKLVNLLKKAGLGKNSKPSTGEGKTMLHVLETTDFRPPVLGEYMSMESKYLGKYGCYRHMEMLPFPGKYRRPEALEALMNDVYEQLHQDMSPEMRQAIQNAVSKALSKGPEKTKVPDEAPKK